MRPKTTTKNVGGNMDEKQRLVKRIQDMGIDNIGITPGSDLNISSEEVAAEINNSLDRIIAGDYTEVDLSDD
jgi:hypothetical protein